MTSEDESIKKMMKYRWAIFAVLALAYFFVYFHRTSTAVVGTEIGDAFGVGAASVALLGSLYFYAYTVMQLPGGLLADTWGVRKTVFTFLLLAAVGAFLTGVATDFWVVLMGRILIGAGVAVVYIPIMRALAMWFRTYEFASLSGILLAIGNVGAIAAATPLALMTDALGWEMVFLLLGVITVILALMCLLIVKDRPTDMGFPSIQEIEAEESGNTALLENVEPVPMLEGMKMAFGGGRKFWPLAIWFFFMYGSIMVYQGLQAGPYYKNVYAMENFSLMITLVGVGMIVGCPLSGILSDRVVKSRRKVLVIGTLLYTVMWAVIWLTAGEFNDMAVQGVINFLFGFFGGWFVVAYAQIKELFPVAIVGTATAALNIFPFAGGAVLQSLSGLVVTTGEALAEFETLWMFMFICMIIASIAALLSVEKERA